MLELIFQGFMEWAYGLTLECWEYFSSSLLSIMSMDYRTVRHSRGYKGGYNHFITRHELEKWSYAHLLDALCALRKDREFDEQAA